MATKQANKRPRIFLKKGDQVLIISGDHKNEKGEVKRILAEKYSAIVEGMNMVTRHVKPTAENPGGKVKKEAPIHLSNLMLVGPSGAAGRFLRREKREDGKVVRIIKLSNQTEEVVE